MGHTWGPTLCFKSPSPLDSQDKNTRLVAQRSTLGARVLKEVSRAAHTQYHLFRVDRRRVIHRDDMVVQGRSDIGYVVICHLRLCGGPADTSRPQSTHSDLVHLLVGSGEPSVVSRGYPLQEIKCR